MAVVVGGRRIPVRERSLGEVRHEEIDRRLDARGLGAAADRQEPGSRPDRDRPGGSGRAASAPSEHRLRRKPGRPGRKRFPTRSAGSHLAGSDGRGPKDLPDAIVDLPRPGLNRCDPVRFVRYRDPLPGPRGEPCDSSRRRSWPSSRFSPPPAGAEDPAPESEDTPRESMEEGLPSPDRARNAAGAQDALKALTALAARVKGVLPRRDGKASGEMFRRLGAADNGAIPADSDASLDKRRGSDPTRGSSAGWTERSRSWQGRLKESDRQRSRRRMSSRSGIVAPQDACLRLLGPACRTYHARS